MKEIQKILDDTIARSYEIRPEVLWLKERYLAFMKRNGISSKRDADALLYEKMYAAAPERDSQIIKIRFWRTGHHVPSDRNDFLMLAKALDLDGEEQRYMLQAYADRSDVIFDGSSADCPQYQERRRIMEQMVEEYLGKLHPDERLRFQVFSEDLLPSLRHIYFCHATEFAGLKAQYGGRQISRISSISYGPELLKNVKLIGEIPRKTMIRHILIMSMPFINKQIISARLSALGFWPLDAGHTLTTGERFDAMLLEILALYRKQCVHQEPQECLRWLREAFHFTERYLCETGQHRLRPFYFKSLEKEKL